jgi:hypothetical protein
LYNFADLLGRKFNITTFKINCQIHLGGGGSITLVSDKNCLKKGLTAFLVGASGVPRLDKSIPIFASLFDS